MYINYLEKLQENHLRGWSNIDILEVLKKDLDFSNSIELVNI
jgi:hypothetical protein